MERWDFRIPKIQYIYLTADSTVQHLSVIMFPKDGILYEQSECHFRVQN